MPARVQDRPLINQPRVLARIIAKSVAPWRHYLFVINGALAVATIAWGLGKFSGPPDGLAEWENAKWVSDTVPRAATQIRTMSSAVSVVGVSLVVGVVALLWRRLRDASFVVVAVSGAVILAENAPIAIHWTSEQLFALSLAHLYPDGSCLLAAVIASLLTAKKPMSGLGWRCGPFLPGLAGVWVGVVCGASLVAGFGLASVGSGVLLGMVWVFACRWWLTSKNNVPNDGEDDPKERLSRFQLFWQSRLWTMMFLRSVPICLLIVATLGGPWLVDDRPLATSEYYRNTMQSLRTTPVEAAEGELLLGMGQVDLTPPEGHPLAGFGNRKQNALKEIDSRCFARAITLKIRDVEVTILTSDLLLINDRLAAAVLARTKLAPAQLYFTATHTHSGPGGWGDHVLEQLVTGRYDSAYFDRLAEQLARCVADSRRKLEPAEVAVVTVAAPDCLENRIGIGQGPHDQLTALLFRKLNSPSTAPTAIVTVFAAHATVIPGNPPILGADYPGALVDQLRASTGAELVAFAAGAVGDASPVRPPADSAQESARRLGTMLADKLQAAISAARYERKPLLAVNRISVRLPELQVATTARWRISSLATSWITEPTTHLHVLRIGPAVLAGFPGDYSGDLANRLASQLDNEDLTLVVTSFNGDYKGYFVSLEVFNARDCYETRVMNFFGPRGGELLNAAALQMVGRIARIPR